MLKGEAHVKDLAYLTTLAGYVHWQLTGRKVLGLSLIHIFHALFPPPSAPAASPFGGRGRNALSL